jgi:Family of unknown function (DUF6069)
MTYPASPNDVRANRVRPDSAQFWAGAVATAVVAALIALVGILICRWTLGIPILAPAGAGAWGNAHTGEYVLLAAIIAMVAGAVLYLLVLGTPQPGMFFDWIMGLATLAAVVYPFSTGAPLDQKAATAVVNLVLGIAITSLLTAVAARAVRRRVPPRYPAGTRYSDDARYGTGPGYRADQGYPADQDYPADQRYVPEQRGHEPTVPINVPHRRDGRRWE